jgi:hypothetical protein
MTVQHLPGRAVLVSLAAALLAAMPARAEVLGSASVELAADISASTYTGTLTFDATSRLVFGAPVDLGSFVGAASIAGPYAFNSSAGGAFSQVLTGGDPSTLQGSAAGAFLCAPSSEGGCNTGATFVGQFGTLQGTALTGVPADAVYTFDGSLVVQSQVGSFLNSTGRVTINAFRPTGTPASPPGCSGAACEVPVAQTLTYELPDGTTGAVAVDIVYPAILVAGTTTVSALSAADGVLPADVQLVVGTYRAAFFELETTAIYDTTSGPIEVCISYDLGGTGIDPAELVFLHREGGVFVDRTSRVDPVARVVCGALTSFSPVVIAVRSGTAPECTTPAQCDDGNPCTDDDCSTGQCTHEPPTACAEATKASLKITDGTTPAKDKLSWKFAGTGSDFGTPDSTTGYVLCLVDGTGAQVLAADVPPGGTCGARPCWKGAAGRFTYSDGLLTPDGVQSVKLKAGSDGSSKISVSGKGANLGAPAVPMVTPLRALLRRTDAAACWTSTFSVAVRNDAGRLAAKLP